MIFRRRYLKFFVSALLVALETLLASFAHQSVLSRAHDLRVRFEAMLVRGSKVFSRLEFSFRIVRRSIGTRDILVFQYIFT